MGLELPLSKEGSGSTLMGVASARTVERISGGVACSATTGRAGSRAWATGLVVVSGAHLLEQT